MVFLVGQRIVLHTCCSTCKQVLTEKKSQMIGLCRTCVENIGVPFREVLLVYPPTAASKWN